MIVNTETGEVMPPPAPVLPKQQPAVLKHLKWIGIGFMWLVSVSVGLAIVVGTWQGITGQ